MLNHVGPLTLVVVIPGAADGLHLSYSAPALGKNNSCGFVKILSSYDRMTTRTVFQMPDINDFASIEAHRQTVLQVFADYFSNINDALEDALPKVLNIFRLLDGPVDLAVHAPNTRYLVKQFLMGRATPTQEEDAVDIAMQRVSNCGLCAITPKGTIRILKATADGLPKATSEARERFSCSNQMIFRFDAADAEPRVSSLNLFVLWKMDTDYTFAGMQIALPRRVREDGSIECYWIAEWKQQKVAVPSTPMVAAESDLEEIKLRPVAKKQNEEK